MTEEYDALLRAYQEQDATIRQLRAHILALEETEGLYRTVCAQNARLLERIEDLRRDR